MWLALFFSWVIGLVISMCIIVPFLIRRNLSDEYPGIIALLVLCPIVNVVYPIYIIAKYIKVDLKKFL